MYISNHVYESEFSMIQSGFVLKPGAGLFS